MHDPLTVAFEIRRPWPKPDRYRTQEAARTGQRWNIGGAFWVVAGRGLYWPTLITVWHRDPSGYDDTTCRRAQWRLHVHHWRVQVGPLQHLRRRLLTRCASCGGRSVKGNPVNVSHQWDGPRGRWWQGEPGLFHHGCSSTKRRAELAEDSLRRTRIELEHWQRSIVPKLRDERDRARGIELADSRRVAEHYMQENGKNLAAISRVRALHSEWKLSPGSPNSYCAHCEKEGNLVPWPCPTLAALNGGEQPGTDGEHRPGCIKNGVRHYCQDDGCECPGATPAPASQPVTGLRGATCDASMNTRFTDPLGPCILRHGHDGPVHKDGAGATWWPRQ